MKTAPPWRLLDTSDWPRAQGTIIQDAGIYRFQHVLAPADNPLAALFWSWDLAETNDVLIVLGRLERQALEILAECADPYLSAQAGSALTSHDAKLLAERQHQDIPPEPEPPQDAASIARWMHYLEALRQLDREFEARPILEPKSLHAFIRTSKLTPDLPPIVSDAHEMVLAIDALRHQVHDDTIRRVASLAMTVGRLAERLYVRPSEPLAKSGRKQRAGGRRGHEKAHGTDEAKKAKWKSWQQALNSWAQQNPDRPIKEGYRTLGRRFRVHPGTIRNRTKNPRARKKK